jgi:hypothetical protein
MCRFIGLAALAGLLLCVGCAPTTFVQQPSGWKSIELRPELATNYDKAWQIVVDTVAHDYALKLVDKSSGYLQTEWTYGISGGNVQAYRGRLTVKFSDVKNPDKVEIKTEAAWLMGKSRGGDTAWVPGYDTAFQRDVFTALAGRLGRTVPKE